MNTQLQIDINVANADALAAMKQFRTEINLVRRAMSKMQTDAVDAAAAIELMQAAMNGAAASNQKFSAMAATNGQIARTLAQLGEAAKAMAKATQAAHSAAARSTANMGAAAKTAAAQQVEAANSSGIAWERWGENFKKMQAESVAAAKAAAEAIEAAHEQAAREAVAAAESERQARARGLSEQRKTAENWENSMRSMRARRLSEERKANDAKVADFVASSQQIIAQSEKESRERIADAAKAQKAIQASMRAIRATNTTHLPVAPTGSPLTTRVPFNMPKFDTASVRNFTDALNKSTLGVGSLGRGLGSLSQRMISTGRDVQWLGRQLEFRLSLPIIAMAGITANMAREVDKSFTRLAKVYNGAEEDLAGISQGVRLLSDQFGFHQEEVANVAAIWGQAGVEGAQLLELTKLTSEASIIGDASMEESAKSILTIMRAFQLETHEVAEAMSLLNFVENEAAVGFSDLVRGIEEAGNVAATSEVSILELAATVAVLVPTTGEAGEAGNALKSIMLRLAAPTGEAEKALAQLTDTVENGTWSYLSFTEQLLELRDGYSELDKAGKLQFTRETAQLRQSDKLLALLRDVVSEQGEYNRLLTEFEEIGVEGAMERYGAEISKFLNSDAQQFDIAVNRIRNLGIEIGAKLLPVVIAVLNVVANLAQKFSELSPEIQMTVAAVAVFLALIGPLMGMLGTLGILLGVVLKPLAMLAMSVVPLANGFRAVAASVFGFLNVLRTGIALVGSFAAYIGGALKAAGAFVVGLKATIGSIAGILGPALSAIGSAIIALGALLKVALVAAVVVAMVTLVAAIYNTFSQHWPAVREQIFNLLSQLPAGIGDLLMAVIDVAAEFLGLLADIFLAVPRIIADAFGAGVELSSVTLGALPGIVFSAMKATLDVVLAVGKAIYRAFSYLNPFARHSPSLVENVQNGNAIIQQSFADTATSVTRSLSAMYSTLSRFEGFASNIQARVDEMNFQSDLDLIREVDPGAVASYIEAANAIEQTGQEAEEAAAKVAQLEGELADLEAVADGIDIQINLEQARLDTLTDEASRLRDELSGAREELSRLSSMKITGMTAAEDAMFALSMQAKGVQLQMAQLQLGFLRAGEAGAQYKAQQEAVNQAIEAGETTIASMEDALEGMDSAIESASAYLDDLQSGASDVEAAIDAARAAIDELAGTNLTGEAAIDEQLFNLDIERKKAEVELKKLEQAFGDVEDAPENVAARMEQLQDLMSSLDLEMDIIRLDAEIEFDPQKRLIDEIVNPIKELDLETIIDQIVGKQGEVEAGEAALARITAEIGAQEEVIAQMQSSRDAYAATIDAERDRVEALRDEYDRLGDAISDAEEARQGQIDALQAQLDEINALEQIAQLEYDLTFEPMLREIDKLVNGGEEMGFGAIVAGIREQQGVIAELEGEYAAVNDAITTQEQVIADLEAQRAIANDNIDVAQAKLDDAREAHELLTDEIASGEQVLADFISNLKEIQRAAEEAAGGSGVGAIGDEFSKLPETAGGAFDELIAEQEQSIQDWLDEFENQMDNWGEGAGEKLKEWGKQLANQFWDSVKDKEIAGTSLQEWVDLFEEKIPQITAKIENFRTSMSDARATVDEKVEGIKAKVQEWAESEFWQSVSGTANDIWTELKEWGEPLEIIAKWLGILIGSVFVTAKNQIVNFKDAVVTAEDKTGIFSATIEAFGGKFITMSEDLRNGITTADTIMRGDWYTLWNDVDRDTNGALSSITQGLVDFKDDTRDKLANARTRIEGFRNWVRDSVNLGAAFGSAFDGAAGAIVRALNAGISVINDFLGKADSALAKLGGGNIIDFRIGWINSGGPALSQLTGLESGGVMGLGGPGFITGGPQFLVGEGRQAYSEYVIPTDPQHRGSALSLFSDLANQLGVPQFAGGGIVDGIRSAIEWANPVNMTAGALGKIQDWIGGAFDSIHTFDSASPIINGMSSLILEQFRTLAVNAARESAVAMTPLGLVGAVRRIGLADGGVAMARNGGHDVTIAEGGRSEAVVPLPTGIHDLDDLLDRGGERHYHFHGDLVFPNVTNERDAEDFIRYFEAQAS